MFMSSTRTVEACVKASINEKKKDKKAVGLNLLLGQFINLIIKIIISSIVIDLKKTPIFH